MLQRKTSTTPRKSYRPLTSFYLPAIYIYIKCACIMWQRVNKGLFSYACLNLHVTLACLLRNIAWLCHGVDRNLFIYFHFFLSLMFCEHVCSSRKNAKVIITKLWVIHVFSCCMIKTIVPRANTRTIVNHLLGAPVHWQEFQTCISHKQRWETCEKKWWVRRTD